MLPLEVWQMDFAIFIVLIFKALTSFKLKFNEPLFNMYVFGIQGFAVHIHKFF